MYLDIDTWKLLFSPLVLGFLHTFIPVFIGHLSVLVDWYTEISKTPREDNRLLLWAFPEPKLLRYLVGAPFTHSASDLKNDVSSDL